MSKKFALAVGALVGASLLTTQQAQASTYTVKSGDTISSIAKKKYHSQSLDAIETIVQTNNLENRDLIFVGDKLELPKKVKKIKAVSQAPVQANNSKSYVQMSEQSAQQSSQQQQSTTSQANNSSDSTAITTPSYAGGGDLHSYVTSRMAEGTGVSARTWEKIVQRESNWDANVTNSSGHYGLFQLDGSYNKHGNSVEGQIQDAIDLYRKQGLNAWVSTAY